MKCSTHQHYPIPISDLSPSLSRELSSLPARPGKEIKDQPNLDLLYFEPYIPTYIAKDFFHFLRSELPFYRVEYKINRGGIQTDIRTPRYVHYLCPESRLAIICFSFLSCPCQSPRS